MFLDNGWRSACCHAPIRLGKKRVKNTKQILKIWVCTNCKKRDVDIVDNNKTQGAKSTFAQLDRDDEPMLD